MSAGAWSYDHSYTPPSIGMAFGHWGEKVWNGADRIHNYVEAGPLVFRSVHRVSLGTIKVITGGNGLFKVPKRAKGDREPHDYIMSRSENVDIPVRIAWQFSPSEDVERRVTMWGGAFGTWVPYQAAGIFTPNDQIKLINKLRESIQGSDFNAAVALGEGGQTLKLIADSATRIYTALHRAKRGDFKGACRSLIEGTGRKPLKPYHDWKSPAAWLDTNLAKNWLELQYGWLPLLSDAHDGAITLAHHLNVPLQKTYRAKRIVKRPHSLVTMYGIPGRNPFSWKATSLQKEARYIKAVIKEKPSIPKLTGLTHPESVAWELLPYSFVADWFIPIGDYLTARGFAQGLEGQFVTSNLRTGVMFPPSVVEGIAEFTYEGDPSTVRFQRVQFDRTVSSELDVPMPSFKPLNKALSWQHCTNALALVISHAAGSSSPHGIPTRA